MSLSPTAARVMTESSRCEWWWTADYRLTEEAVRASPQPQAMTEGVVRPRRHSPTVQKYMAAHEQRVRVLLIYRPRPMMNSLLPARDRAYTSHLVPRASAATTNLARRSRRQRPTCPPTEKVTSRDPVAGRAPFKYELSAHHSTKHANRNQLSNSRSDRHTHTTSRASKRTASVCGEEASCDL
jgi:hypothetical protein